jgi:endo-1,3-1,4-beta-glycanase ExoK
MFGVFAASVAVLAGVLAASTAAAATGPEGCPAKRDPAGGFICLFEAFDPEGWFLANFDQKGDGFATGWRRKLVSKTEDGEELALGLVARQGEGKPFFGAEIQRNGRYHHGRYEVVMTPARAPGIVSSFFTYTGPYFDDPHDEIDLEFLGRDTTRVWINRFADGQKMPGIWIELGYDAAERRGLYAFEWSEDEIVWYADDRVLHKLSAADAALPTTPGKIMMNIWAGTPGQKGWTGVPAADADVAATYYCVSFRPPGDPGPQCSDVR